ncbi:PREDICTED: uncharacterized protein LOC101806672 [Ficedula albicollis]|uniref:uncharacterized protein LOC101806672 n=1 Tax=Ficedula albicollis TaxID=59894 RepID=UPI0007AD81E9|nr:PREDICTED: uncharacterized protein LOC101806672 [Ficedula albicollis]
MKPLPSLFILALLLMPWVLGPAPAGQGSGVMPRPCCDAAGAAPGVRGSSQEYWKVKPEPESPWLLAYVPIRNCHRVLKDKYGEFSPPAFHADFPVTFWCNWTIWAGSRRHIIIYIQGFIAKDACNKNEDKILFEGVSSLVENSVVYACWKNEMHVFATFAQAVHVVLLKRYLPNQRDAQFKGKYYIFQDQQGDSSSKDDAISGTSVSKLPKRGGIFQSGWVENLRGTLGFATTRGSTTVLSSEPMQGRGITLDTTAVGRPTELILCERARTQALETKAPCGLGSELLGAQEAQGIGRPEGIIPTAAQDIWGQNPSVSEDSTVSFGPALSALLETPLLGAFQPAEPFLQPTLETPLLGAFQPAEPFLQPTDLMDVFPLRSSRGAVRRRTVPHPTAPGLAVPALATGLEHPLTHVSALGTETNPVLVTSSTAPVPTDSGSLDLIPEAPLPPQVESVSTVASLPAAVDRDPVSLGQRDISPASPGGQEMVSPSPPCHPSVASELGIDGSSRCLSPGMQKLVLGQAGGQGGQTTASVGLMARSPSPIFVTVPGPGVRLTQPEAHVSSGSGVPPASLSDTREEHKVHQDSTASDKPASAYNFRGFKMQGTPEALQVGAGQRSTASFSTIPAHPAAAALWGETLPRDQKIWKPSGVPRNTQMSEGQQRKHAELGSPWVTEYFPIRSCHLIFQNGSGMFYLPLHADIEHNIWCNWTIWAGPQKHIVIYVQGFQGSDGCANNQDKIIFQGVSSSVETKVVFACHNRGTLIFAAQATEVQVLFLSGSGFRSHEYRCFKGQYYVFRDSETVGSSSDTTAAPQETSKKESWRTVVTKGLLPMLTVPPGPPAAPAGGRIQHDIVSPEVAQHSPDLVEDGQSGANLSEHGQDETRLERNLKDGGSKDRETEDDLMVDPAPAGQDTGGKAEPPALELTKGATVPGTALFTMVPCHPAGSSCSEMPSSSVGVSDTSPSLGQASDSASEVAAAAHHTQTPVMAEPPPNTNTKPPPYPSPGVTAADVVSLGGTTQDLFDLMSSVKNDTGLQPHPGDVLFEVTVEIKPKDWIPHGGNEFQKGLLESLTNHIQKNLKFSDNRVSEMKLKDVKRTSDANLLLTFWLHLEPEERNVSLLLRSQLERLLGTSVGVEKLQLVSLFVEDVNECQAGLDLCGEEAECFNGVGTYLCRCRKGYEDHSPSKSGTLCIRAPRPDVNECQAGLDLCGEEAECFNGVGTYLCRCKKGYEDHSPTKSGTLCIRAPRPGISAFLRQADTLAGAALAAGLALLAASAALCLRLKLRARTPEWLWSVRAHHGPALPEPPPPL